MAACSALPSGQVRGTVWGNAASVVLRIRVEAEHGN
jgi:hypothetical protein